MLGEFCEIIKEFKIVPLTLNKGMAYDGIRNPVSHRERRGFAFGWIPIRYHNSCYGAHNCD